MKRQIIHITLAIAFYFLSGSVNGVMDTLKDHYAPSIFPKEGETLHGKSPQYWDPRISWKNKYKDWDNGDQRPAFTGAKTYLVWLTDGWHRYQFYQLACMRTALILLISALIRIHKNKWLNTGAYLLLWIALIFPYSAGFFLTYNWLLIR